MGRKILYHYSREETYRKIISNKTIRLTDLDTMNDVLERKHILSILYKELEKYSMSKNDFNLYEEVYYSDNIHNHYEYIKKQLEGYYQIVKGFGFCLSKYRNSNFMWEEYGDNHKGLCIGFNYIELKKLSMDLRNNSGKLQKVNYSKEYLKTNLRDYIREFFNRFINNYKNHDWDNIYSRRKDYIENELEGFMEPLIEVLNSKRAFYKDAYCFQNEGEFRAYLEYSPVEDNIHIQKNNKDGFYIENYNLNSDSNKTRSSVDISFKNYIKKNIIKEVIIGSECKLSIDNVISYLEKNSYNISRIDVTKN